MTTVSVEADEELLAKVSQTVEQPQSTWNALFADALERFGQKSAKSDLEVACAQLREPRYVGVGPWTRDEMNHRPMKFLDALEAEQAAKDHGNHFLRAVRETGSFYMNGSFTHDELNER